MRTVIAIALHRRCPLPQSPLYLPVQAGAALHPPIPGTMPDDAGPHISDRNPRYCELTVHYALWQQVEADTYGLCHYRRYFTRRPFGHSLSGALTEGDVARLLRNADVIVPYPRLYLIETNESQYAHAHRAADLHLARAVIADRCAEYLPAFDQVMKRRWGRRFNMFIMRREAFAAYSQWLFGILFEMERRLGDDAPERVFGYIAERLMDVWLEKERPRLRQVRVMHTESQHWPKKIAAFVGRKLRGGQRNRQRI